MDPEAGDECYPRQEMRTSGTKYVCLRQALPTIPFFRNKLEAGDSPWPEPIAVSPSSMHTARVNGRLRRKLLIGVAAISGICLLAPAADTIEVDPASIQGRTEAAIAEFRAAVALEPDLKHGAELFGSCTACHASDGQGAADGSVPAIAGQHVSVIVKQLVDFRHDRRWDARMRYFSRQHGLAGPQDLLDVAAYAESLPRGTRFQEGPGDAARLQQGFVAYHRDCASCHGPLALGDLRSIRPRLAGQHYRYLAKQLEETAAGTRPGMDQEHVRLIHTLSASERAGVADYLSRLTPDLTSKKVSAP